MQPDTLSWSSYLNNVHLKKNHLILKQTQRHKVLERKVYV